MYPYTIHIKGLSIFPLISINLVLMRITMTVKAKLVILVNVKIIIVRIFF